MAVPPSITYSTAFDGPAGTTIVGPNLRSAGNISMAGNLVSGGALNVVAASATALTVATVGTTNPTLRVDSSTATVATGFEVKGAAAAGGVALTALSSGTNESLTLDAKGTGTITLAGTSTGAIVLGAGLSVPKAGPAAVQASAETDSVLGFFAGTSTVGQKLISFGYGTAGVTSAGSTAFANQRWSFTRIGNFVHLRFRGAVTPTAGTSIVVAFDISDMGVAGGRVGAIIPVPEGGFGTNTAFGGLSISGSTVSTMLVTTSAVTTVNTTDIITVTLTSVGAFAATNALDISGDLWYDITV